MKKIIALFTITSLFLLSEIPIFSYNEETVKPGEIYFAKNFDDNFFGEKLPFDNMTIREQGNVIKTEIGADGNRYMLFEKRSPDYPYADGQGNSNFEKILSNAITEQKMVLQFDVMPKDAATKLSVQFTDSVDKTKTVSIFLEGSKVAGESVLSTSEWTTVRMFLDFSGVTSTVTVYANDKEVVKKEINNIKNFWRVRFHSEKGFYEGKFCFDNFLIYSGEPIFDDTVYNLDYKSTVRADNVDITDICAISSYGEYIIGGIKGHDSGLVKCEDDVILISTQKLRALYGETVSEDFYLPYDEALLQLGKNAVYDDRGFIYWSDSKEAIVLSDDVKWDIHNLLAYQRPSADYLKANIKKSHPRLEIEDGRIDEIKREISENKYAKWYYDTAKSRVESTYNAALLNSSSNKDSIMMKARTLRPRVKNLALWYYLIEDNTAPDAKAHEIKENIKSKIWENVEAVINDTDFPHWQPNSGLDNAEMVTAVAYAYDWLYEEWNTEQRELMEEALYKKGLVYAEKIYGCQTGSSISWWINSKNSNQNAVINGGYAICALVLMDKYPEEASYVLEKALRSMENFQNSFYPDGAWLEGTTYLTYSMQYWVPTVTSIKLSYGTDFGLLRAPGIDKSPEYIMQTSSLNENYNYHDSEQNKSVYYMGSFFGLAKLYNEHSWADWKLTYDRYHKVYYGFDALLNLPSTAKELDDINLPKDASITRDAIGAFRENWLDPNGMYLSYHGGNAYPGHGHCDTGSFVYEYDGVRFAVDLPSENYSITGDDRLKAYRVRPEGHNCLIINPDQTPGHNISAFSPIERFETNNYGGFGILNMSDTYADYATNVRRGFKTDDNRNSMIIRDEIEGIKTSGKIYWFMHTYAGTTIKFTDAKTAILTNSGKSIKVEFLTNSLQFEAKEMMAVPLDSSPELEGQSGNEAYKKIAFVADCEAGGNIYIQAKLSPVTDDIVSAENIPLENWMNDGLVKISDCQEGGVRAEIAKKDLFPFIALYKGNDLYRFLPAKNNSYDGMTVESESPNEENISAKLFVWENKNTLVPIIEALPINIGKTD